MLANLAPWAFLTAKIVLGIIVLVTWGSGDVSWFCVGALVAFLPAAQWRPRCATSRRQQETELRMERGRFSTRH